MKIAAYFIIGLFVLLWAPPVRAQEAAPVETQADAAFNKKEWKKAVVLYTAALALDPKNEKVYYYRGYAEYELGQYAAALSDMRHAAAINSSDPDVQSLLGDALNQQGHYTEAIAAYTSAIDLQSDSSKKAPILKARADSETSLDRYQAAIADYQQALALVPNDTTTLHSLANAYYATGNDAATEKNLQAALKAAPGAAWSYAHLGVFRWLRHRYAESITYFTRAISIEPKNSGYLDNRAVVYASIGSLQKALADNDQARKLDKSSGNYDNRAILYWIAGKTPDALREFAAAIKKGSDDALANRGALYLSLGQNANAAVDLQTVFDRYAKKNEHNSYPGMSLAIAYGRLHQNSRALSTLQKINAAPEGWPNPLIAHLRGQLGAAALLSSIVTNGERVDAYTYGNLDAAATGSSPSKAQLQWVVAHASQLEWELYYARSLLAGIR